MSAVVIQMPSEPTPRRITDSAPPSIFVDIAKVVIEIVCAHYQIAPRRILKRNLRSSGIVGEARHVALALTPGTTTQISKVFGGDQSTVTFARNKIQDWEDVYPQFKAKMDRLRAEIGKALTPIPF